MTVQLTQQMGTHSRDWGNRSGAWNGYALAPAETQDGDHVVSVGVHVQRMGSLARLLTSSLNWPGRFANRRSGLLSNSIASRLPPSGRGFGRASRNLLPRLARTQFMHGVMAPCSQVCVPEHFDRQVSHAPECHSSNASLVRWFNANEHMKGDLEPCSLNRGKRLTK